MSVNDLHWPKFKCHITIHLTWPDLKVIFPLIFQHTVCPRISVRKQFFGDIYEVW